MIPDALRRKHVGGKDFPTLPAKPQLPVFLSVVVEKAKEPLEMFYCH